MGRQNLTAIIIRAALSGHIKFDAHVPNRFATIGECHLFRPVVGAERWAIWFGHTTEDFGLDLSLIAHNAVEIARRYSTTGD